MFSWAASRRLERCLVPLVLVAMNRRDRAQAQITVAERGSDRRQMEAQKRRRVSIGSSEQSVVVIPRRLQRRERHPEYGRWRWDSDFRELIQSSPAHAGTAPRARARSSMLTTSRKSDVPWLARLGDVLITLKVVGIKFRQ